MVTVPGFLVPGLLVLGLLVPSRVSAPTLTRVLATGQERCNKPESSAAKLYCLHLQEPESKRTRAGKQEQEREKARTRERKSKNKREREREWQNPVPFKENYSPPRTYYSLIGCSPSAELSSRGRQSTWSRELPLAHAQIICLPLRTQLSAPSYNGKCEGGSSQIPLFF